MILTALVNTIEYHAEETLSLSDLATLWERAGGTHQRMTSLTEEHLKQALRAGKGVKVWKRGQ